MRRYKRADPYSHPPCGHAAGRPLFKATKEINLPHNLEVLTLRRDSRCAKQLRVYSSGRRGSSKCVFQYTKCLFLHGLASLSPRIIHAKHAFHKVLRALGIANTKSISGGRKNGKKRVRPDRRAGRQQCHGQKLDLRKIVSAKLPSTCSDLSRDKS